eukprot:9039954-Pyramimonas_sp.AAC.2
MLSTCYLQADTGLSSLWRQNLQGRCLNTLSSKRVVLGEHSSQAQQTMKRTYFESRGAVLGYAVQGYA